MFGNFLSRIKGLKYSSRSSTFDNSFGHFYVFKHELAEGVAEAAVIRLNSSDYLLGDFRYFKSSGKVPEGIGYQGLASKSKVISAIERVVGRNNPCSVYSGHSDPMDF